MRKHMKLLSAALAVGSISLAAVPTFAQQAAAATAHYSVETTQVGTLLDDPAAAKILERLIPDVYANDMFKTMGRSQSLKNVQQYEPDTLTDAKLAEIQAEFDKLAKSKG